MTLPTGRSRAKVCQTGARLLLFSFYVQILAEYPANVKLNNLVKLPFKLVKSGDRYNITITGIAICKMHRWIV